MQYYLNSKSYTCDEMTKHAEGKDIHPPKPDLSITVRKAISQLICVSPVNRFNFPQQYNFISQKLQFIS